jgi:LPPG:FO 2-phospho-L-lactate transferase
MTRPRRIIALTGGVGGAKLAHGLSQVLAPDELLLVVNTGDDFEHLGLHISPDIDSLTYALAAQNNTELGWGRTGETWQFIETLKSLGGESWFRLGDKDLALHVRRTGLLRAGHSLTAATQTIATAMGIEHPIAPMSDDPVRTFVHTEDGPLAFQHYFVRERCAPAVTGFDFKGIDRAELNPLIEQWLTDCTGVIICPSNPYVSVDPILNLPGMRDRLQDIRVVAVSPIVGGIAIKGPAAKMMAELNVPATATAVADYYSDLIDGFVLDETDAHLASQLNVAHRVTNTIMDTMEIKVALARATLDFLDRLPA